MPRADDLLADVANDMRTSARIQRETLLQVLDTCSRAEMRTEDVALTLHPGEVVVTAAELRSLVIALNAATGGIR